MQMTVFSSVLPAAVAADDDNDDDDDDYDNDGRNVTRELQANILVTVRSAA